MERSGIGGLIDCTAKRGAVWNKAVEDAAYTATIEKANGGSFSQEYLVPYARKNCHRYWAAIPKRLRELWERAEEIKIVKRVGLGSLRECAAGRKVAWVPGAPVNARNLMTGGKLYGHEHYTNPEWHKVPGFIGMPSATPPSFDAVTERCERALKRLPASFIESESYRVNQPKVVDANLDEMMRTSFVDDMAKRGLKRLLRKRAKERAPVR